MIIYTGHSGGIGDDMSYVVEIHVYNFAALRVCW